MKRRLLKLARRTIVLLLLGAIINVAVVFALIKWGQRPAISFDNLGTQIALRPTDAAQWRQHAPAEWTDPPDIGLEHRLFGKRYLEMLRVRGGFDAVGLSTEEFMAKVKDRKSFIVWTLDCGWPRHCAGGETWQEILGTKPAPAQSSAWRLGAVWLPSRISGAGFVLNSIFYMSLVWLSAAILIHLRRLHRKRRNLCPACAYPVGSSPVCTECGQPVTSRRPDATRVT